MASMAAVPLPAMSTTPQLAGQVPGAQQLLADAGEERRVLGFAVAQVGSADGAVDPVRDDGRARIEQRQLANRPARPEALSVGGGELVQRHDQVRLPRQQCTAIVRIGNDPDDRACTGPVCGVRRRDGVAQDSEPPHVRHTG